MNVVMSQAMCTKSRVSCNLYDIARAGRDFNCAQEMSSVIKCQDPDFINSARRQDRRTLQL